MRGVTHVTEACHFHALGYHVTDGPFVHGPIGDITFEEIFFGSMISIIGSQVIEDEFRKDGESIFVSFSLHYFDLHGIAVNTRHLKQAQLVETKACTVKQSDHAAVLDVFHSREQVKRLLLREDWRKLMFFSGKQLRGKHIRFSQHVFVKEAEALSRHATLVAAQVERRLEIIDVEDDLITADGKRIEIVEVRKQKPDFGDVISNGSV